MFVGSSSEGLEFARAARSLLATDAEVTIWNEDFFELGKTFIETLIDALQRFALQCWSLPQMICSPRAVPRRLLLVTT